MTIQKKAEYIEAMNDEKERKIQSLEHQYNALKKKYNDLKYENHNIHLQMNLNKSRYNTKLGAYKSVIKCAYGFSGYISCFYIIDNPLVRKHFIDLMVFLFSIIKSCIHGIKAFYLMIFGLILSKSNFCNIIVHFISVMFFILITAIITVIILVLFKRLKHNIKNILESYNIYNQEEVMLTKTLIALVILMDICVFVYSRINIKLNIFIVWCILAIAVTAIINAKEIERGLYISKYDR